MIHVLGLGAGTLEQLPLGVYRKIKETKLPIYTRTKDHPVISELEKEGIEFISFDYLYEKFDTFEAVYQAIKDELTLSLKESSLIYLVPGHPLVAESTVQLLLLDESLEVKVRGGESFLDALFTALKIDPIDGFQLVDATSFSRSQIDYTHHVIFGQVYDSYVASQVKLELLEDLPAEYEVYLVTAAGTKEEVIKKVPLYQLDRVMDLSNLTSLYLPPVDQAYLRHTFSDFKETVARLRGPGGCPWDQKQTHESLRKYALEEVYELIEAINEGDIDHMIEELGDVLLQVMLHSQIGEDDGYFSIDEVIQTVNDKMIRRHPHVFGEVKVESVEEVNANWEAIKQSEGRESQSILADLGKELPALQRASELKKRAKKAGFDWSHVDHLWAKLDEEVDEFKEAIEKNDPVEKELELGDILFVVSDLADYYEINPELALMRVNDKFTYRFGFIEEAAKKRGLKVSDLTKEEMKHFWEQAKEGED